MSEHDTRHNGEPTTDRRYLRRGERAYHRANLALFLAGFVTFSTLYTFQPLFPALVRQFALSPMTASLSLSVATFALAWTLPLSGSLSDACGRRAPIAVAVVLTSLLTFACAAAPDLPALLALRLLQGVILAGVPAVAMAYLSEEVEPASLGRAMGLYIAGNALGGMSGRIVTAWLADALAWRGAVTAIAGLGLILSLLLIVLLPPSRNFRRRPLRLGGLSASLLGHLRNPDLLCLFLIAFAAMGGFVTLYNYVTFRLLGPPFALDQGRVAFIFSAYAFGAFGSGLIGALSERFGRPAVLFSALVVMATGLLLTLPLHLGAVVTGIVVFTVGFFGAHAVASAWVGALAGQARAQASSLYLFAYYLGSSVSGTGGGFFYQAWGWGGVVALILLLIGIAATAGLVLSALLRKRCDLETAGLSPEG